MSNLVHKDGFDFTFDASACSTCQGRCCTGESGYIYVTKIEVQNLAQLLNLEIDDFVRKYLFKKGYKYSIKERIVEENHECIFYDKNIKGCGIYEARPIQCKTFPFWDYFKTRVDELKAECPGIAESEVINA